jgi:hypothetical protein
VALLCPTSYLGVDVLCFFHLDFVLPLGNSQVIPIFLPFFFPLPSQASYTPFFLHSVHIPTMNMDISSNYSLLSISFPSTPRPHTLDEWKDALNGVKQLYVQRQYKQCQMRSMELLAAAKKPVEPVRAFELYTTVACLTYLALQINPVHKTYLHFYTALAYEFQGRAAHVYSSNKISLLRLSLDHFITCNAALPGLIPLRRLQEKHNMSVYAKDSSCEYGFFPSPVRQSLVSNINRMIDSSLLSAGEDPFISDRGPSSELPATLSLYKPPPDTKENKNGRLFPSPLRIRKPSVDIATSSNSAATTRDHSSKTIFRSECSNGSLPPPLPLKIIPASRLNSNNQRPNNAFQPKPLLSKHTITSTPKAQKITNKHHEPISFDHAPAISRFNNNIEFLRSQITSSITSLQSQIDHITELQQARRARNMQRCASFWTFSPVTQHDLSDQLEDNGCEKIVDYFGQPLRKESKEQRIARLRAEGWHTVGLRSCRSTWKGAEYYQEYCNAVLDELYLNL